ncbi:MAG: ribonuclease HII [Alphaproteobacteria bacterium]|nr:ribonuclease HII [Alphaproteobacteria bacterium]
MPDYSREAAASGHVAGIDEVGRGAWAGPVFAAAAILSARAAATPELAGLDDSKTISKTTREQYFDALTRAHDRGDAWLALGRAEPAEIDALNILGATMLAMQRAVTALPVTPDSVLVDGNRVPDMPCPAEAIVKGDGLVLSIAAASIYAKVSRDRLMADLARDCPGYGWERNVGYGTREHQDALARLGATVHHRKSFAPIKKFAPETATSR